MSQESQNPKNKQGKKGVLHHKTRGIQRDHKGALPGEQVCLLQVPVVLPSVFEASNVMNQAERRPGEKELDN